MTADGDVQVARELREARDDWKRANERYKQAVKTFYDLPVADMVESWKVVCDERE